MIAAQVGIAVCGVSAIWLAHDPRPAWRRWSPVLGLAGQPFWLAETVSAQQWGIAALCLVYTASWWRGFRLLWLDQRSAAR